jgi:5-methylcytosine-specific restriction endonuclease McrA
MIKRARIFTRDSWRCVYCGSEKDLTVDHKIPKSKGGTNKFDNLQTLCYSCNQKKSNKI